MKPLRYKTVLVYSAILSAICVSSECIAMHYAKYDLFFPRTATVVAFLLHNPEQYLIPSLYTCAKIAIGLLIGMTGATLLSFLGVWFPSIRPGFARLSFWSQTVPVPLLAPLLGLAFGYNIFTGSLVPAVICFFPIYLGWEQGRMALSSEVSLLAASYQPSRMSYTLHVLLPAGLPHALLGIKGAVNLAVLGAVIAEFGAVGRGLGMVMLKGIRELDPAKSWGVMLILVVIATAITLIVDRFQQSERFSYMGDRHDSSSET